MNLNEENKRALRAKHEDTKVVLLENYYKSQTMEQSIRLNPKEYIERLENKAMIILTAYCMSVMNMLCIAGNLCRRTHESARVATRGAHFKSSIVDQDVRP